MSWFRDWLDRPSVFDRIGSWVVRHPAPTTAFGWRSLAAVASGFVALAGIVMIGEFVLMRFPGRAQPELPEQPVSPWLWESGLALAGAGTALALVIVWWPSSRQDVRAFSDRTMRASLSALSLLGLIGTGFAAAVAGQDSQLAWFPGFLTVIGLAAIAVAPVARWWRTHPYTIYEPSDEKQHDR